MTDGEILCSRRDVVGCRARASRFFVRDWPAASLVALCHECYDVTGVFGSRREVTLGEYLGLAAVEEVMGS